MSSWTFETFETQYKNNPNWHIYGEYRWEKSGGFSTFVGVFNEKGMQISTIFENIYGTKEQAKRSFKRQIAKLRKEQL